MQAFVRLAAALLILVVAGSSFAQLPVAIDPEAMIERIVAVDEKQRSEVRDLVLAIRRGAGEDVDELAYNSSINGSNGSNPRPMGKEDYLVVINGMM